MTDQRLFLVIGTQTLAVLAGALCNALFIVWHTKRQIRRFRQGR